MFNKEKIECTKNQREVNFVRMYGKYFARFLMEKQLHMEVLRKN